MILHVREFVNEFLHEKEDLLNMYIFGRNTLVNLYERIDALCREKGVSKGKMCSDIGISQGAISDLKVGRKKSLSAQSLAKIAKYFGTTITYLLGDTDIPSPAVQYSTFEDGAGYLSDIEAGYVGTSFPTKKGRLTITSDDFDELAEIWNTLKDRSEMKILFKSAKGATKEQVEAVAKMLDSFKTDEVKEQKQREWF